MVWNFLGVHVFSFFWFFRNCVWKSFFQSFLNLWWQRWDKRWEFFEVKEKYSSVQVFYPSCKAHRMTTLGHPYQNEEEGGRVEHYGAALPGHRTSPGVMEWCSPTTPLRNSSLPCEALNPNSVCCWNWDPPFLCVGWAVQKQKAVYVDKLFYTWSSPRQPNGDVVKSFLLYPIVLFNRFGWPVGDTRKVSSPTLNLSVKA